MLCVYWHFNYQSFVLSCLTFPFHTYTFSVRHCLDSEGWGLPLSARARQRILLIPKLPFIFFLWHPLLSVSLELSLVLLSCPKISFYPWLTRYCHTLWFDLGIPLHQLNEFSLYVVCLILYNILCCWTVVERQNLVQTVGNRVRKELQICLVCCLTFRMSFLIRSCPCVLSFLVIDICFRDYVFVLPLESYLVVSWIVDICFTGTNYLDLAVLFPLLPKYCLRIATLFATVLFSLLQSKKGICLNFTCYCAPFGPYIKTVQLLWLFIYLFRANIC